MSGDAAVQQIVAGFMDAWNRHDAPAFAALFAPDADLTNVAGITVHGRDKIEKFHARVFAARFKGSHQTAGNVSVRWVSPQVVAVDVRWSMTGVRDESGAERPERSGLLSWIVAGGAGGWSILVMHNQDLRDGTPGSPGAGAPSAPSAASG